MSTTSRHFEHVIADIGQLRWGSLAMEECVDVAWAYYFFSIQFRENLEIARRLHPADDKLLKRQNFLAHGKRYLDWVRGLDQPTRAMSIASYEDGGLEAVFTAMLTMPTWDNPVLMAFRHFLSEHIRFDSDPDAGHGALARHLQPDDRILPLWVSFRELLITFVPGLQRPAAMQAAE